MENADVLTSIVKHLGALSKSNSSSDDVQYLDTRDFNSEVRPLVKAINDSLRCIVKRTEARLKADKKKIRREIECYVREQSQANMEETLEGAHMGIWAIEAEHEKEPRMYGDKTMSKLLGIEDEVLTPEEVYRVWYSRVDAGYYEMVNEAVEAMKNGKPSEVVYPWLHPKAGQIYIRCGGVKDYFDKAGFRVKGYHQDVTETMVTRRRQERAMFDAIVEAKKANAAKTEFISNMSHDIRTPINGILGMLDIAEKNVFDMDRQAECRRKVRMAAEHLASLINDVLDISKIESGSMAISNEVFNVHELIDNSMAIVGPQAEESGITLKRDYSGIVHPCLMGSPLHLRQIIINIIGNGIKYNNPGGFVSIHTEELGVIDEDEEALHYGEGEAQRGHLADGKTSSKLLDANNGKTLYRFIIEDNGIGMSEEFLSHLFEPFTQEGKDARTNYRGTGLGMAITKGLVEQMDGTIKVQSKTDEGTKIIIELPFVVTQCVEKDGNACKIGARAGNKDISGMTVLLAEDNDINREIAEYMLNDAGATVVNAANGKEAYDAFVKSAKGESQKIDCILMDVMMPVMDGLEAARKIRYSALPDAQEVPIITLSANAFTEDEEKAKAAGMNAYLTKPLDTQKMIETVASFRRDKQDKGNV